MLSVSEFAFRTFCEKMKRILDFDILCLNESADISGIMMTAAFLAEVRKHAFDINASVD